MKAVVTRYQPWSCDLCGKHGTVEFLANQDAALVEQDAKEDHELKSPACPGKLRFAETSAIRD